MTGARPRSHAKPLLAVPAAAIVVCVVQLSAPRASAYVIQASPAIVDNIGQWRSPCQVTLSFPALDSLGRPWQQVTWDFERGTTFMAAATGTTASHLYPSPPETMGQPYRAVASVQATDDDGHVTEEYRPISCYPPIGVLRVSPAAGTVRLPATLTIESSRPLAGVSVSSSVGSGLSTSRSLSPDMSGLLRFSLSVVPRALGPFDVIVSNRGGEWARYRYVGTAGKPFNFRLQKLIQFGPSAFLRLTYVSYTTRATRVTETVAFERCRQQRGASCRNGSKAWRPVPGRATRRRQTIPRGGGFQQVDLSLANPVRALRASAREGDRLRVKGTARVTTRGGHLLFADTRIRGFRCRTKRHSQWC
jgi:hypothetical protein